MASRTRGWTAAWLVASLAGHIGALVAVWWVFVRTARGQFADTVALAGNTIGRARVEHLVRHELRPVELREVFDPRAPIEIIRHNVNRVALCRNELTGMDRIK